MVEPACREGQTDRRMRTGWSKQERQTQVSQGLALQGDPHTTQAPAASPASCPSLTPPAGTLCPLVPSFQSLHRPCAWSFPPGPSSPQPPLPLCLYTNRGLPASLHSSPLTHSHSSSHSRPAPPRTVSAAVSPSLAWRPDLSGSVSASRALPRSPSVAVPGHHSPPLRPHLHPAQLAPGPGWSASCTARSHLSAQSQPAPGRRAGRWPSDGLGGPARPLPALPSAPPTLQSGPQHPQGCSLRRPP